jgi:hypothetical protein
MSSPSIVPTETFYIVRDRYPDGDVFRETEVQRAHFDEVLSDFLTAQYHSPIAVYAFNPEEGWARDVSREFARELQGLIDVGRDELSASIDEFMRRHSWHGRQLSLAL